MSHETDESLQALAERNPNNQDILYLIDQYRNLMRVYDTLRDSIAHLLAANLLKPEDAARLRESTDPTDSS